MSPLMDLYITEIYAPSGNKQKGVQEKKSSTPILTENLMDLEWVYFESFGHKSP